MSETLTEHCYCIPCTIDRGGFSNERTFEFNLTNGGLAVGLSDIEHLMDSTFQKLRPNDCLTPTKGYVKCRTLKSDATRVLVDVPQGETYTILRSQLIKVPA